MEAFRSTNYSLAINQLEWFLNSGRQSSGHGHCFRTIGSSYSAKGDYITTCWGELAIVGYQTHIAEFDM